jgi:ABC-type transport system substrate-binding protein
MNTALTVAVPYEPRGFNEVYRNYTGGGGYFVANQVFSRLVVLDVFGEGAVTPDLAERWEVLEDGMTYRFHLRSTTWHDGKPLRAADVVETYMTAIRHGYRAAASLGDVDTVIARSDRIVDIGLKRPNSGFLAQLSIFVWTHILPAHLYAGTDWATNAANEQPVGTGAFRFVEWERGKGVRVAANPTYWRGRPSLDAAYFRVVPDIDDALAMLRRGDVDFVTQDVPCERYEELAQEPGVGLASGSGSAVNHVTFNFTRDPWKDRRVREAVALAIDRDRLAKAVCQRAEAAQYAYLKRIAWVYDPSKRFPSYAPDRAASLLDAAGHVRGADGVRIRGRLVCRGLFPFHVRLARELGTQLREAGIDLDVVPLDAAQWREQVMETRDFDLLVDGLAIGPDPVFLEEWLASDSPLNAGAYRNAALDEQFEKGKSTHVREERAAAYREAQRIIVEDLPRIHLIYHVNHHGYRTRWAGWSWTPGVRGRIPFWSLERISRNAG